MVVHEGPSKGGLLVNARECQLYSKSPKVKGATVVAGEMTIAEGHLLLCFAGLGKQLLRGTTTTNDCTNRRQRPVLRAAVVSIATNYVATIKEAILQHANLFQHGTCVFAQDWLSFDSHRRGTEVLTWAPIIHSSTTTRPTLAKS